MDLYSVMFEFLLEWVEINLRILFEDYLSDENVFKVDVEMKIIFNFF